VSCLDNPGTDPALIVLRHATSIHAELACASPWDPEAPVAPVHVTNTTFFASNYVPELPTPKDIRDAQVGQPRATQEGRHLGRESRTAPFPDRCHNPSP
jgi:hypothetical protein